jgi:hypothetical protein
LFLLQSFLRVKAVFCEVALALLVWRINWLRKELRSKWENS